MNRSRFVARDFQGEGSQSSHVIAAALAEISDPDFLRSLLLHKQAVDEFGGEIYIAGAPRERVDAKGDRVESGGAFETFGYVFHYSHKAKIRGVPDEPDADNAALAEEVQEQWAPGTHPATIDAEDDASGETPEEMHAELEVERAEG